ncbi:hypothetical protein [Nocardia sp.]|uniref:hypothetical protein n=1 Tax=Nocardia sp. TaxID=1821 RepID=UPI00262F2643|nr:hypothetical protein [Nocardia sp.]
MTFTLEAPTLGAMRCASFRIGPEGICSICAEFQAVEIRRDEEYAEFLEAVNKHSGTAAVVAVSGGRDSLSALWFLKHELGLEVIAVCLDSGYMVPAALTQLRELCATHDIDLRVFGLGEDEAGTLTHAVETLASSDGSPCHLCSTYTAHRLTSVADECGAPAVVFGTNHFFRWDDRPIGLFHRKRPDGRTRVTVGLPYVARLTRSDATRHTQAMGALIQTTDGISTNCHVPALLQVRIGRECGHVPELEMLSLEVITGHLTREEALADVIKAATASKTAELDWLIETMANAREH